MLDTRGLPVIIWTTLAHFFFYWVFRYFFFGCDWQHQD